MTGPVTKSNTETQQPDTQTPEAPTANIENYAQSCAAEMPAVQKGRGRPLPILQHFNQFSSVLQTIYQQFSQTEAGNSITSYAQEWLLDNFYIVQQSLSQVHENLPARYYYELPKLIDGKYAGYARIYALGRAFVTYTEGHITQSSAQTFLISFQEHTPLTMGELWAWPTILRLCALENLIWSLEKTSKTEDFTPLLKDELRDQLTRQHPEPQLVVASSITNMRLLNTQDWSEFFESVSRVEGILRQDPASIYTFMDFETRNQYRDVIEKLARRTGVDEERIAVTVLHLAQQATSGNTGYAVSDIPAREQSREHVGFYLIDDGYHHLLETLNFNTVGHKAQRWFQKHLLPQTYIVTIALATLWIVISAGIYARLEGGTTGQVILTALFMLIPATAIAINLINWLLLQQIKPAKLPKLDFAEGVPDEFRTVVVIPALLNDTGEIDSLVAQLELHYLRNIDPNLRFAILADYTDAPEQHMPLDDELATHGTTAITELNRRYGSGEHKPFYFLLRERRWNASENTWMGHERKRGKLAEFNRLLLDANAPTTYSVKHGDMAGLRGIRYLITLDADTVMPHNTAHCLIGTMAHPLNQAVFSADGKRVIAGYTVLQPRVELLPTVKNSTMFAQVMGGDAGFDLYTLAVSDIYQDLFGEGVYVGKGIYDVEAFERSTAGRIPENALLSHDLFEGVQGRAGLVTDIVLIEDYPTHYLAFTRRLHRWIRGDWQLLPWLFPYVPQEDGSRIRNHLSTLSYWKIFDNLRRSLERPAILALLVAGWAWLPGSVYVWTVFALLVLWVPFMLGMFLLMRATASGKQRTSIHEIRFNVLLKRWSTSLLFLPYESLLTLDAIIRTLYRLVRRKHLLEWVAAASTMRVFGGQTRFIMWQHMASGVVLAIAIGVLLYIFHPSALLVASPLLAGWILAPAFAEHLSQPYAPPEDEQLTEEDTRQLRMLARRTWLFFEAFVGPEDHWLPPDHFQRYPEERVKHYTSPTNIGLMLISTLGAREMGYIGLLDLMLRLQFALDSIDQLERYRGHLLNWYQTQSLDPLFPRYVSTVDSGNYAGCLIALKEGCRSLLDSPALNSERWQGFLDILDIMAEVLGGMEAKNPSENVASARRSVAEMRRHFTTAAEDVPHWTAALSDIMANEWPKLEAVVTRLANTWPEKDSLLVGDLTLYFGRLHHHASSMQRDIESLLPWQILHQRMPTEVKALELEWRRLEDMQISIPHLRDLPRTYQMLRQVLHVISQNLDADAQVARSWCDEYIQALDASEALVLDMLANFEAIQQQISQDLNGMDFRFLYDQERDLFRIGYNVETEQADSNHYDLLASEARLASYIAIAKNDAPYKHWLHLGRPMILLERGQVLHSWSGTMFEYLMPMLLMQHETETLLNSSASAAVSRQITYGKQHNTPWGISESGFYAFDINENFQYRSFGVPDLALRRGQDLDHVIAPYASLLALPLRPAAVLENLRLFKEMGVLATYGLMEAVDYTTGRLPLGHEHALVDEYMAHHQGMVFISLVNFLQQDIMVRHFHANPYVTSVELLLLEQIPPEINEADESTEEVTVIVQPAPLSASPWEVPVEAPLPYAHYLSNGRYGVMLTSAGSGYSQWGNRALTRWRADTTLDDWGTWLYIRDEDTGNLWSAGYQPIGDTPDRLSSTFYPHKAEFVRRDYNITSRLEIVVPPDDDVEIRYLTLTNHGEESRRLMICSYSELVLAPQSGDQRHQAFNKMFIESDYLPDIQSLIFQRRLRSAHDEPLFVLHRLLLKDTPMQPQYETDRAKFLGRHGTVHAPQAQTGESTGLTGTIGATLDPIMALAHEVEIAPYETVQMVYLTIAGNQRSYVINQANSFGVWAHINHAADQARYRVERELHHLNLDMATLQRIQTLYSALMYPHPMFRAPAEVLAANNQAQPSLWTFGISGEYPIVLVDVSHADELGLVRELVQAHTFWRNRGINTTLVILNRHDTGYDQALYTQLRTLILRMHSEAWLNRHAGIFIVQNVQLNDAGRTLLQAAARVYLQGNRGMLSDQLALQSQQTINLPRFIATLAPSETASQEAIPRPQNLQFDNGYGGFTEDGHEYVIYITPDQPTPAPWINVIANEMGGFIVTESGGGYSWAYNSGENRLTNWQNDPVTDRPGEAIYLRDEETGAVWSPTPAPANSGQPYCVRHGAGYTTIEHHYHDLEQTVHYYGASEDPVKFVRVRLKNTSSRTRRITVTYYAEWVLGPTKDITQQYLIPSFDANSQTILVNNPYSIEFGDYHAFLTASKSFHSFTTDRAEFLGRMGSYHSPTALKRMSLSGAVVAGADVCAVVQLHVDLPVDGEEEVCFILGQGKDRVSALDMSQKHREETAAASALTTSREVWRTRLDSIVVRTPDKAMNILLPWLLYQTLACRIWGRSALYQSSGAYGFRDQLQDVMALVHTCPEVARQHILNASRHQFEAGDVLHWWHPPSGRGVRTRFADDLLWLPFVVAHYVYSTDDASVLQETVPFLKADPLRPDEEERYGFYQSTSETFTVYEHCRRALERGHTSGMNNLPLMQAGDWNDGMNRVGIEGRGESVWMAWFLLTTMRRFLPLCTKMGDHATAITYQDRISTLKNAVEQNAWDGAWYRRAYYDDGTPLGSLQNAECKIDSLTQSWAVISGMADPKRAKQAMKSVDEWLVKEDDQLIKLFTPPFNDTLHDPGYIKGYPPGVRENGGQYTHAALWVIWAFAEMGMGHRAEALFRLLNPIYHASTQEQADLYGVEPYVIAADVYGEPPHTGQGGWTWYTGSAGWMYRLGIEAILGLRREGSTLHIAPRISPDWPRFEVDYRYGASVYHILVENPNGSEAGVESVLLDDNPLPSNSIPLVDDGQAYHVTVIMGS